MSGEGDLYLYEMHVELIEAPRPIWRRLRVPSDLTFADLHEVLQVAMGWEDSHVYEFRFGAVRIGIPDDEYPQRERLHLDARYTSLASCQFERGDVLTYLYDFGDEWLHLIRVDVVFPDHPQVKRLECLDGAGACPPEDVGGVSGYAAFLEAITDPTHEEHFEYLQWVGGPFDPADFNVHEVNRRLARLKVGASSRYSSRR
ncbi:MAG: plasmid pRiA4b ORF-3 family protein [Thermoflavifilum sp.]|nr:plasmid pRiA4b ORF-3 family protein [Thermoflavifilum sp.]MCL6514034.1 plasmid pRiA4b ORF-3 family protein [Alicyclobacillus sp.]